MPGMRSPKQPLADQGGVVVLAHRGFSGCYPQNTMLAFRKAAELPIDGLEMDIHATKDGHLVVFHDDVLEDITNGQGKPQDHTLAELRALDAAYHFTLDGGETFPFRGQGLTIPTMAEVLEEFTDLWLNVDIKQHDKWVVEKFCELINQYEAHERLCVGSFSSSMVRHFRSFCPQVVTVATLWEVAALFVLSKLHLESLFDGHGRAMQIAPVQEPLGVTVDIVTPRFLRSAHKQHTAVHLWTINEMADMQRFVDMGVDGIITDCPHLALEVLGRLPEDCEKPDC